MLGKKAVEGAQNIARVWKLHRVPALQPIRCAILGKACPVLGLYTTGLNATYSKGF